MCGILAVLLFSTNLYVLSDLCTCVFLTSNKLTPTDLCLGVCLLRISHSSHWMQHRAASRRNGATVNLTKWFILRIKVAVHTFLLLCFWFSYCQMFINVWINYDEGWALLLAFYKVSEGFSYCIEWAFYLLFQSHYNQHLIKLFIKIYWKNSISKYYVQMKLIKGSYLCQILLFWVPYLLRGPDTLVFIKCEIWFWW